MSTQANIVRIAVDPSDPYRSPTNKITGGPVYLPRNRDIALQIGFFELGQWMINPSHLATITAEVRPGSAHTGAAIITANTATVAACQSVEWDGDTNQHMTITLPSAQTAGIASADTTAYWLVITAITTGGKPLTLLAGLCIGVDDGGNYSATVPAASDPTYYTAAQVLALLASLRLPDIEENGFKGRWGIDVNGAPVWHEIQ